MVSICVFCGSRAGIRPEYAVAATEFGARLAARGHTLVYGGGRVGMMGAIADSMLNEGGRVIGVIPQHLAQIELMHPHVADMRITRDMHERKSLMHQLSDAYVALPGGYGTLEELFEAVTWAQLDLHARPVAILNIDGLYDGLLRLLHDMLQQDFLTSDCHNLLHVFDTTDELSQWIDQQFPSDSVSSFE